MEPFEQLGISRLQIKYLPLATSERRHPVSDPGALQRHRCDVSFVGESLIGEKMSACGSVAGLLRQYPHNFQHREVADVLDELNQLFKEVVARAVDRVGDIPVTREKLVGVLPHWFVQGLASGISEYDRLLCLDWLAGWVAHEFRRFRIEQILEHASQRGWKVKIYGDEGWRSIAGVAYCDYAEHYDTLNCIYSASRVNIDIPRTYQRTIVTMRVFDVLACGGFMITEFNNALAELCVPGEHLECYYSTSDLIQKLESALSLSDERLRAVAEKGRAHIVSQHTLKNRVPQLVAGVVSF
jgi:spore maturation protein CgeB